jgi:choline kinase
MKAIIIGAGRGSRLEEKTDVVPKTLVQVMGRPMLDWILDALSEAGFERQETIFICGYAEDEVKSRYPDLTYIRNADWENNNILLSLLEARAHLTEGFLSTYADIIYEGAIVQRLVESKADITLGCDTRWRRRYVGRSQHPETDAEKMTAKAGRVLRVSRHIASEEAYGEFIGVMRLTAAGATRFLDAFDRAQRAYGGGVFREGRSFQKAYLIDLLQEMLEGGIEMSHADTPGAYMELDTLQDLAAAERWWAERG